MTVAAAFAGPGRDARLQLGMSFYSGREHRLEMRALLFSRNHADLDLSETAFFHELMQLHFAESEPVICIQFASAFEPVAQKIENHQSAATFQNPPRRGDGSLGMNSMMQSLTQDCKVDTVFRDRRIFNIAKPVLEILESVFLRQLRAEVDHFGRIIDGDHFTRIFCQQLRKCPFARSEVSHSQRR